MIYFVAMLILMSLAAFNMFYHLGDFPIFSWDEARHGVSAYEMIKSNNYIVNTYRYQADYWNLKPPLSFWMIIAGYKIAGYNALGLRIFSAIFSILTIFFVSVFVYKKYGKLASLLTVLVLSTSTQYILWHSSRTGDADALFVFLFTIAILSLLQFNHHKKWLYLSGFCFSLAFLTKSWHAGTIAVIIGLYLFLTAKYKKLSFKNWLILCMCMFLPILIWAGLRFQYDGLEFFKKMTTYDLLHRSTSSLENHVGGHFFYFSTLLRNSKYWVSVLCITIFLLIINRNFSIKSLLSSQKRNDIIGICLWILIPFILFSFAKTKINWYILPIYPPLAVIMSIMASKIILKGKWALKIILIIFIVSISIYYESQIYAYLKNPIPNYKQNLIAEVTDNKQVKSDSLFIYHLKGNAVWLQSEALTAELADDLHVNDGNFSEFQKSNHALLLIPKNLYSEKLLKTNKLRIMVENKWGYLAKKDK